MTRPFVQLVIDGLYRPEDIDDFIEKWHKGDGDKLTLHAYLGMSLDEYTWFVIHPEELDQIISRIQQRQEFYREQEAEFHRSRM